MFDLIDECGQDLKRYGYVVKELEKENMSIAYMKIDSVYKAKKIGMAEGEYYIFNSPYLYEEGIENDGTLINQISLKLKLILSTLNFSKKDNILIVGLGNPDIDSDKLGKVVFDNISVNIFKKNNNIFKFCPNIFFSTGIETFEMVKILVKEKKIKFVFIIDSLTTSSLARLGTSFQLTTSGMTPGSGVNRFGKAINKKTIGVNCISIGVPFMIFASSLTDCEKDVILSPKDIKENVERAGFIIAKAITEVIK